MDRQQEYEALRQTLAETPPTLASSVQRAQARLANRRRKRLWGIPAGGLVALLLVFMMLVNSSTSVAYAIGRIPVLANLAQAVAFSPSLKAAVEHEFVQPLNLSQTQNGITMTVEYLIVDKKQVNIFFSLQSPDDNLRCEAHVEDEGELSQHASHFASQPLENGLYLLTVDFFEQDVPDTLPLFCAVWQAAAQSAPLPVGQAQADPERTVHQAEFNFRLNFDPYFTEQGHTVEIGQWLQMGKQQIYVRSLEIYPSHIRLNLEDNPQNSAWLSGLEFQIIGDDGSILEPISNGITASGTVDSPFMASHRLNSNYFANHQSCTIQIIAATWLEKEQEQVTIDLTAGTAETLPEGIRIQKTERQGADWLLEFAVTSPSGEMHSVFQTAYLGSDGQEYDADAYSTYDSEQPEEFIFQMRLTAYPYPTVNLLPWYTQREVLSAPLVLTVEIPQEK